MTHNPESDSGPSISGKQLLLRLLDNPPPPETFHSEVQLALDDGNIRAIRLLAVEDQAKLLEVVDQVRTPSNGPPLSKVVDYTKPDDRE